MTLGGTRRFWAGLIVGWSISAVGVVLIFGNRLTPPADIVRWMAGAAVIHDAVLLPIAVGVGLATMLLPLVLRLPVRVGIALSWVLFVVAWPGSTRNGVKPDNPTLLPRDVGHGLRMLLAIVWLGVVAEVVRRLVTAHVRPSGRHPRVER